MRKLLAIRLFRDVKEGCRKYIKSKLTRQAILLSMKRGKFVKKLFSIRWPVNYAKVADGLAP